MSFDQYQRMYLGTPDYPSRTNVAAMEYHLRTEEFDQRRCSYRRFPSGIAVPMNAREARDCTENSLNIRQELCAKYELSMYELKRAISNTAREFEEKFARSQGTSQHRSRPGCRI